MNYMPIHTNIAPNYNYLSAENAYLKQDIEYKNVVLAEQQQTIGQLKADVQQLSMAATTLKADKDKAELDAARWHTMKKIILSQGGEKQLYEVQKTVDKDIEFNKRGVK